MNTFIGKLPPWIILLFSLCTAMQVVSAQDIGNIAFDKDTTPRTLTLLSYEQ